MKIAKIKYNFILIVLSYSILSNTLTIAKRNKTRKSSSKKIKPIINTINKDKTLSTELDKNTDDSKSKETNKNTDEINKNNCENYYIKCMNKNCHEENHGICKCNNSNEFEKNNSNCSYILNICISKAEDIKNNYKRIARNACLSSNIVNNKINSWTNKVAELTECMQKKCKSKQGEFIPCFDDNIFNTKLQECEYIYENSKSKEIIISSFKESIETYKQKYCNDNFGTYEIDRECHIKIGIGASPQTINTATIKDLKINDIFSCSEQFFNTDIGESKLKKLKETKGITLFSLGVLKAGLVAAEDITVAVVEQDTRRGIKSISSLASAVQGPHLREVVMAGLTKNDKQKYKGFCYAIKDNQKKELFPIDESNDTYYKLRWYSEWIEEVRGK